MHSNFPGANKTIIIHPLDARDLADPYKSGIFAVLLKQKFEATPYPEAIYPLTTYTVNYKNKAIQVQLATNFYNPTYEKLVPRLRSKTDQDDKIRFVIPAVSQLNNPVISTKRNENNMNICTLKIENERVKVTRENKKEVLTFPVSTETDFDKHYERLKRASNLTPKILGLHFKHPTFFQDAKGKRNLLGTKRYFVGQTLLELEPLTRREFLLLQLNLWKALQVFHQSRDNNKRVAHRDIKPENIVATVQKDENGQIKEFVIHLIDPEFVEDVEQLDRRVVGTLQYMAPEQLKCKATQLSDVYSMVKTIVHIRNARLKEKFYDSDLSRVYQKLSAEEIAERATIESSNIIEILTGKLKSSPVEANVLLLNESNNLIELDHEINGKLLQLEKLKNFCNDLSAFIEIDEFKNKIAKVVSLIDHVIELNPDSIKEIEYTIFEAERCLTPILTAFNEDLLGKHIVCIYQMIAKDKRYNSVNNENKRMVLEEIKKYCAMNYQKKIDDKKVQCIENMIAICKIKSDEVDSDFKIQINESLNKANPFILKFFFSNSWELETKVEKILRQPCVLTIAHT